MDSKLQSAIKSTDVVIKKDKERRKGIVTAIKQFAWTVLMIGFGASCVINYYQAQELVTNYLSVK